MNKKLIFILGGFFVVTLILFILSLFADNQSPINNVVTTPTPIDTENSNFPTSAPDELSITNVLPSQTSQQTYLPFQKITLTFNANVSPGDLTITTTPITETTILQGPSLNELFIIPKTSWSLGKTTITINNSQNNNSGKRFIKPFVYTITTAVPTLPPEVLEDDHP